MKSPHEEAFCQVVQVMSHGQHVVALPPGTGVETPTLHARAEATDGVALLQCSSLVQNT